MTKIVIVNWVGIAAGLIAAVCWLRSAIIPVPHNIDTIVDELRRIARWNAYGAFAAVVAALCATYIFTAGG